MRLVAPTLPLQGPADQEVGVRLVGVVLEQLGRHPDRPVELGGVVERARQQEAYVGELVAYVVAASAASISSVSSTAASR